jgi:hypothetical protein
VRIVLPKLAPFSGRWLAGAGYAGTASWSRFQ